MNTKEGRIRKCARCGKYLSLDHTETHPVEEGYLCEECFKKREKVLSEYRNAINPS